MTVTQCNNAVKLLSGRNTEVFQDVFTNQQIIVNSDEYSHNSL